MNKGDKDIENRIIKLRSEISRLRGEYHIANNPSVTDDVYESLTRELHNLETKYPEYADQNSMVNRVAGAPLPSFKKVKHESRMLSMNDAFSYEEIAEWQKRITKLINKSPSYFCELKLDGLSASLIYLDGVFVRGATRGDGFIGEDVTENLKMISTIPMKLKAPYPSILEVRGEVVMPKSVWSSLNQEYEKLGKQTFANTRNAAAGSLRQLDSSIVKNRKLELFAWDIAQYIMDGKETNISNHSDKHKLLRSLGFQVAPYEKKAKNLAEIYSYIEEIGERRDKLPYGTDGMVISVDELDLQEVLGVVGKAPRFMLAYKYPAERATTVVLNISVNVGRTGVLTPVAHFKPTAVAGSIVSKATLHNIDQINRLDIRIGDTVVIQKAGDVIPEVVEVLVKMRKGNEQKFKMPECCPVCNASVEKRKTGLERSSSSQGKRGRGQNSESNGLAPLLPRQTAERTEVLSASDNESVAYYCTNKNCPARSRRGLQHFVNIFEIYEIGPKILDRLKDEGLISDAADLFTLEKSDLSGLERFGEKSADNIITSINTHKKVLLWRFIYALGIIHVGEQTARDLANHFGSIDKLMKASIEEINHLENIGPVVSGSVISFFHDSANINFINKLRENGVAINHEVILAGKFTGQVFVITGTLENMSREDAKKKIIELGGSVSSAVSSKTSYVLVGENPGSKLSDAKKHNVKTLSESEFLKMI